MLGRPGGRPRRRAARRRSRRRWPRRWPRPREAAGTETSALAGVGVGSPGAIDPEAGHGQRGGQPLGVGRDLCPGAGALGGARHPGRAGQRRPGRDDGRVRARRRARLRLDPGRLLGNRRRRRPDPRRQALDRPRRGGRDRAHGGQGGRRPLSLRAQGVHGGLRGHGGRWRPTPARSTRRATRPICSS